MADENLYVAINGLACISPKGEPKLRQALAQAGFNHINNLVLRAGRDYSYGYFLLPREDIEAIAEADSVSIRIVDGGTEADMTFTNFRVEYTISLFPTSNDADLSIVKLVDRRFVCLRMPTRLEPDPFPPHTRFDTSGTGYTFATTNAGGIEDYWDDTNIGATIAQASADYPSILLRDIYTPFASSSWLQMNDILSLLCHSVYQTFAAYQIYPLGHTLTANATKVTDNADRLMLRRDNQGSDLTTLPETVYVKFPKFNCDIFGDAYSVTRTYSAYGGTDYVTTGTKKVIYAYNVYDPCDTNQATYATNLNTLGQEIADLFYDSFDNDQKYNAIYFGAIDFDHSPECHELEWYHDVVDDIFKTRIKSIDMADHIFPPIDENVVQMYRVHEADACDCDCPQIPGVNPATLTAAGASDVITYVPGWDDSTPPCLLKVPVGDCAASGMVTVSSGSDINSNDGSYFKITGGSSPYSITGTGKVAYVWNETGSSITVEGVTVNNTKTILLLDVSSTWTEFNIGVSPGTGGI